MNFKQAIVLSALGGACILAPFAAILWFMTWSLDSGVQVRSSSIAPDGRHAAVVLVGYDLFHERQAVAVGTVDDVRDGRWQLLTPPILEEFELVWESDARLVIVPYFRTRLTETRGEVRLWRDLEIEYR